MNFANLPPEAYAWLAGSFVVAILVDFLVVRLLFEVLKPASAYVFWIGRAGKLAGLIAWVIFFNRLFYARYFLAAGQEIPQVLNLVEWSLIAVLTVVAVATHPKAPRTG